MKITLTSFTESAKNVFALVSHFIIYIAIVVFFFFPGCFSDFLYSRGFKSIKTPLGEMVIADNSARKAGLAVSDILQNKPVIYAQIERISQMTKNPKMEREIAILKSEIDDIEKKAFVADESLKINIENQQKMLLPVKQANVISEGWIFLGSVTSNKGSWISTAKRTVVSETPSFQTGQSIAVIDSVYLHEDDKNKNYSKSPILSVVKEGQLVEIVKLEYYPSKNGGLVLWAKVKTKK